MITVVGVGFRHAPEIVQKTLTVFDSMPKIFEVKDHFILISVASDEETKYVNKLHNTFFH
jgi:aspartokinase